MQCLYTGPFERGMQVRIPVVPELHHTQERLQDRLILVITTRRAERHHRRVTLEDQTRRQRVARARVRANLVRSRLVQPELFTANAHADARITENHRAWHPATTRGHIED